ncbi:uncharacterized protein TNCV_2780901 [Trichonephila clavipes]|nr:uncharacterized protein TNCV_2780901 [Trichonephila clavipes]
MGTLFGSCTRDVIGTGVFHINRLLQVWTEGDLSLVLVTTRVWCSRHPFLQLKISSLKYLQLTEGYVTCQESSRKLGIPCSTNVRRFQRVPNSSAWSPNWPPTWLYRQDFVKFSLNRHYNIRSELLYFQNQLSTKTILNYEEPLKAFSCIKARVEAIDKEVSFLIFCNIVYNSSTMYYLLHTAFDPDYNKSNKFIEIISFFLFNFAVFIVTTVSASLVGEASQEIASTVRSLTAPSVATGLSLQRFLLVVEKDICLTVWKIVPIRRNFIIGTMGAILTYSALFHGLNV